MNGKLVLPPAVAAEAAAADAQAVQTTKPPADKPISTALEVFDRLFAAGLRKRHAVSAVEAHSYVRHAFYAGARAAFYGVIDSMREQDEGELDGEKRFAAIEREIDAYFTEILGRALIARGGRADG